MTVRGLLSPILSSDLEVHHLVALIVATTIRFKLKTAVLSFPANRFRFITITEPGRVLLRVAGVREASQVANWSS